MILLQCIGRINLQNSSTTGGLLGSFRTSNANEKDVDNSTREIVHAQEEEIAELRTLILKLETALKISEEENKQKADILSAAASVADHSQLHESGSGRSEESKPEVFPTSLRNQHSAGTTSKLTSKAGTTQAQQQQHPSGASSRGLLQQPEGEAADPGRQDGDKDVVLSSRTSRESKNSDNKPIYGNIAESNRIEYRSSELEVEDNNYDDVATDGASPKQKYQEIEQFSFTYRVSYAIQLSCSCSCTCTTKCIFTNFTNLEHGCRL